jgi:hypothetical protein
MDASLAAVMGGILPEGHVRKRRLPEWFSSVSVITGDEILLKMPAFPQNEDRRRAYGRSSDSRPLRLSN